MTPLNKRVSAREYAARIGVHEDTVQAWCRRSRDKKTPAEKRMPIVAIKIGRSWMIDVAATDRNLAVQYGTASEKSAALTEYQESLKKAA